MRFSVIPFNMKKIRLSAAAFLLLSIFSTQLFSQVESPSGERLSEMEAFIKQRMSNQEIPGFMLGVLVEGELVYSKAFGLADVEKQVPVDEHTVFEIGSISKQFAATLAILLEERGRLKLDDPIQNYIANLPSEWYGVTIYHLLTHTSGIPDYESIMGYYNYRDRFTPQQIIEIAHSRPMDFKPGENWNYSIQDTFCFHS